VERRLFQDLVASGRARRPRGAFAVPISVALHAAAGALAAIVPMVTAEVLPPVPLPSDPIILWPTPPPVVHIPVRPRPGPPAPRDRKVTPPGSPAQAAPQTSQGPALSLTHGPLTEEPPPGEPPCFWNCGEGRPDVDVLIADGGRGNSGGTPTTPIPVGGRIREPKKLRHVIPAYPELAKKAGVTGVVILECVIDERGRVASVSVLRGVPLLDEAAVEAVRQWAYTPTLLNGVPVPVVMTVTVHFTMERR
jgi:protein TonB